MIAGMSAGVGGIVAWRRAVASTPEYAIGQVALAIRQHNGTKLAYYADGAVFSERVVDETTDWLVHKRGVGALMGIEGVATVRGKAAKIQTAKLAMTERLNRALGAALMVSAEDTVAAGARVIRELTAWPPLALVLGSDHVEIRTVGRPAVTGSTAEVPVTLECRELQIDIPIALVLQREGKRWRVVGLHGLERALSAVENAQMEQLTIANRPLEQQLLSLLRVGTPSVQRVARGRTRTVYRLRVPVTNASSGAVVGFLLGLRTRATDDEHATPLEVRHTMPPGSTSTEVWQFDETAASGTRVAAMLSHPERLVVRVRSIVVDSAGQADTVRLFRSYRELRRAGGLEETAADSAGE